MVGDSHLAKDVTQGVFAALAQNAGRLAGHPVLSGWLHRTTRNLAANTVRSDVRRRAREQEAATMNELLLAGSPAGWEQVTEHLDAGLDQMEGADRDALLLRYFENKSAREMAALLGVTEDAAQKRVSRAVEKLRDFFSKQGLAIGAPGLVALISANAVLSAPAGLATTILTATSGITATVGMTTIHKIIVAGFAAAAIGCGVYSFHLQKQAAALQQQQTSLNQQIEELVRERDDAKNQLAALLQEKERSRSNENELLSLRGKIGVLRQQRDELAAKNQSFQDRNTASGDTKTNSVPPQVHIKARFLTMPQGVFESLGGDAGFNGVLIDPNFRVVLHALQQRSGVETLAEPEVVTTTGRQTQMRATEFQAVITNYVLLETNNAYTIAPQNGMIELGSFLDVTPNVLSDGYTIELPVITSAAKFMGYAPATNTTPAYTSNGQEVDLPTVSPQFDIRRATNSVNLLDNQTLVFTLNDNSASPGATDKATVVFVTVTIVDPAGNRAHPNDVFTNIPPQPDGP